jgi:leucyl-tRNA synthetase
VQKALWPTPSSPPDQTILDAGAYVRSTLKSMRDAELTLLKKMGKVKGPAATYDPKKAKSVRIIVATTFPEWQDTCVQIIKQAYDAEKEKVDDAKVKSLLAEKGLIKDKRMMPFVQNFKVSHS